MRYLLLCFAVSIFAVSCSPNNVTEEPRLAKMLEDEKLEGVIGVFHNLSGDFVLSDRKIFRDTAVTPGSSFDIIHSLIAVETGRLMDGETALNGISLQRAFREDSIQFFMELAQVIGKDTLQRWIDTLGYARRYDTPRIKQPALFWLDPSFRITADEQLGIVKKLYFDQLPFQRRTHSIVSDMMLVQDSADVKLSYKISSGVNPDGQRILWLQGWKEIQQHPHFFVILLKTRDQETDLTAAGKRILNQVLAGFLP